MTPFFNFLVYSNFYISFGAALLSLYYAFVLETNFFVTTPVLIFAGTYIGYHFIRVQGQKNHPHSHSAFVAWFFKFYKIQYFLLICLFFILAYSLRDLTLRQLISFGLALFIVLFYEANKLTKLSLRKIQYIKPFIIALCWSLVCVSPMIEKFTPINTFLFFECFVFILLLSIPFDLKDRDEDLKNKVKTFAHLLDEKILVLLLNFFFGGYLFFCFIYLKTYPAILALMLIMYFLGLKFRHRTLTFNLMIDGIIIIKGSALFYL